MKSVIVTLLAVIGNASIVYAFGQLGHFIIGEVTHKMLSKQKLEIIDNCEYISSFNDSLGIASSWADSVKRNPRFRWTSPLHYYDIENDPPLYCGNLDKIPDTPAQNIFTGIDKAVNNLVNAKETFPESGQKQNSCGTFFHFNMLVHLMQDLHQPLHLTGKERGGNSVLFYIDNKKYNLHTFWDSKVLDLLLTENLGKNYSKQDAVEYFYELVQFNNLKINDNVQTEMSTIVKKYECTQDIMDNIRIIANDMSQNNCDLLWNYNITTYREDSMKLVEKLILTSIDNSVCMLNRVL